MSKPYQGFILFITHHQNVYQHLAARFFSKMESICFLIVHYSPGLQQFVVNSVRSSPLLVKGLEGHWPMELFIEKVHALKDRAHTFCMVADANLGDVGGAQVSPIIKTLHGTLTPHHVSLFTATEACQDSAMTWLIDKGHLALGETVTFDLIEQCRGLARKAGFSFATLDTQSSTPTVTPRPVNIDLEEKPERPLAKERITLRLPQHVVESEPKPEVPVMCATSPPTPQEPAPPPFWAPLQYYCGMLFCCCKRRETVVVAPASSTPSVIEITMKGKMIP